MEKKMPFNSAKIIEERISEADLNTYLVGFDINDHNESKYRWKELINLLQEVIFEFAFGHHLEPDRTKLIAQLSNAAKSIYRIEEFIKVKEIYVDNCSCIDDDDGLRKSDLKRGEFGELILHLLLRDFHSTVPLLSKIYFKDSYGVPVHGFDAVHIQPENKTMWLGESKLYTDGKKGVEALIKDIKEHFQCDYLNNEFMIISKKIEPYDNIPEKEEWLQLMDGKSKLKDILNSVTIPLLCTYSSDNFSSYDDENQSEFVESYEKEVRNLKKNFDEKNDHPLRSNLNIVLLLFPVQCKNELIKRLHKKLYTLQGLEDE